MLSGSLAFEAEGRGGEPLQARHPFRDLRAQRAVIYKLCGEFCGDLFPIRLMSAESSFINQLFVTHILEPILPTESGDYRPAARDPF
jgi:hypothetical protein